MLDILKNTNLALAFGLELAMLAAYATWAMSFDLNLWLRIGMAVLLVAVAIAVWAIWAAPTSATRLPMLPLMVLKVVLFGLAVAGLWAADHPVLGVVFAALAVLNFALAALWEQL